MKAHQIIDCLARLDEAAPVEEPVVEPDVKPDVEPAEPVVPTRRPERRPSPFEYPPDWEPGHAPNPKADTLEAQQVKEWLEMTEQPVEDWDWDGSQLRLRLENGSTEVYSRNQLNQAGVFSAFSESEEEIEIENEEPLAIEEISACPCAEPDKAAGTLDMILGRTECPSHSEPGPTVIELDGKQSTKLMTAIDDVISAILGATSERPEKEPKKEKKKGKKPADKDDDKPADKDDDKDE
jgi:hypothetical protein